jgi:hypothetical protein
LLVYVRPSLIFQGSTRYFYVRKLSWNSSINIAKETGSRTQNFDAFDAFALRGIPRFYEAPIFCDKIFRLDA